MPMNHGAAARYLAPATRPLAADPGDVILLVGTASVGPINQLVLCSADADDAQFAPVPEVAGYTIPAALRAIRKNMANAVVLVVNARSADWTDPAAATKIIGGVNATTGVRSGIALIDEAFATYGLRPTILVSPGFSALSAVRDELNARAAQYRAVSVCDVPVGTTVAAAIAGRGPNGTVNLQTSSNRCILAGPYIKAWDPVTSTQTLQPYSPFYAGMMAGLRDLQGVEWSPSNTSVAGVLGVERALSADFENPNCAVNMLNGAGICTIYNNWGTGYLAWGNRSAAYPTNTGPDTFICCLRTLDELAGYLLRMAFPYTDKPATPGMRDHVLTLVRDEINQRIAQGRLLDGRIWIDPARNAAAQLANGWTIYSVQIVAVPPNEYSEYQLQLTDHIVVPTR